MFSQEICSVCIAALDGDLASVAPSTYVHLILCCAFPLKTKTATKTASAEKKNPNEMCCAFQHVCMLFSSSSAFSQIRNAALIRPIHGQERNAFESMNHPVEVRTAIIHYSLEKIFSCRLFMATRVSSLIRFSRAESSQRAVIAWRCWQFSTSFEGKCQHLNTIPTYFSLLAPICRFDKIFFFSRSLFPAALLLCFNVVQQADCAFAFVCVFINFFFFLRLPSFDDRSHHVHSDVGAILWWLFSSLNLSFRVFSRDFSSHALWCGAKEMCLRPRDAWRESGEHMRTGVEAMCTQGECKLSIPSGISYDVTRRRLQHDNIKSHKRATRDICDDLKLTHLSPRWRKSHWKPPANENIHNWRALFTR